MPRMAVAKQLESHARVNLEHISSACLLESATHAGTTKVEGASAWCRSTAAAFSIVNPRMAQRMKTLRKTGSRPKACP